MLNRLLSVLSWIWACITNVFGISRGRGAATSKRRLVIAGGSFGGLAICRELTGQMDQLDVIVVEPKEYVEYTPGMLRALASPTATCNNLQIPLKDALPEGVTHIKGYVDSIHVTANSGSGKVTLRGADISELTFDFLVIATGSVYPPPCKAHPDDAQLADRFQELQAAHDHLNNAKHVVIVGAGPVGVECAAELRNQWPTKRITVLQKSNCVLTGLPQAVVDAAAQWLQENAVEVLLGQRLQTHERVYAAHSEEMDNLTASKPHMHTLVTDTGLKLKADAVLYCVGTKANADFMARSSKCLQSALLPDGRVLVDETLRVTGLPINSAHIFAVGDVLKHPFVQEPLLAYTAEKHAHAVGNSIKQILSQGSNACLCRYPLDMTGLRTSPDIMCVSLGPSAALLAFDGIMLTDRYIGQRLAALMKTLIETTKVWQLRNNVLGVLFWGLADRVSLFLHRVTPKPKPKTQ